MLTKKEILISYLSTGEVLEPNEVLADGKYIVTVVTSAILMQEKSLYY